MRQKLSDLEIQRALAGLPGWSRRGDTLTKTYTFEKFADGIACTHREAEIERELVADGFTLEQFTDRRSGLDRRSVPRGIERRRDAN